jgi:hypothetical protein
MKVYYAPRIMQALVIVTQQIGKEASKMHLEDMDSLFLRHSEQLKSSYERGQRDILSTLSCQLTKTFSVAFPSDSAENLMETLKNVLSNKEDFFLIKNVECSLTDLYRLSKDTEKIIAFVEQGLSFEGRVKLKRLKINVKVVKDVPLDAQKDFLQQMFSDFFGTAANSRVVNYISALQEELKEVKNPKKFEVNFLDDKDLDRGNLFQQFDDVMAFGCKSSMNTQEIIELRFQKQQRRLLKEKEWEKHQIYLLKEQVKNKKKRVKAKQLEQLEMEKHLKRKNLDIEKERQELDRLKSNYYREKQRIQASHESKSRKISEVIAELASTLDQTDTYGKISPITETDALSDISYISDCDVSFDNSSINEVDVCTLQKRISELETLYKAETFPDRQEKIRKDLDSLKNYLINLRSSAALKNCSGSVRRLNSFKNLNENCFKSPVTSTLTSPKARCSLNLSQRSAYKSNTATPKSGSFNFRFDEIAPKEKNDEDYELKKFLRVQEVRLKEKEERVESERLGIIESLKKMPNANQVIPFLQKEFMEFKRKNQELEKKIRDFDQKEVQIGTKESLIRKMEKDLEVRSREVLENKGRLDEEKAGIIQTLGKLKEEFER